MSDLFEEPETKASYERLIEAGLDQRIAFMTAATDAAFRHLVRTGSTPLEAYARSVGELARINALLEGFGPKVAKKREILIYTKTLREGLDDPVHPHAERLSPK
jgi:hypothetical protein